MRIRLAGSKKNIAELILSDNPGGSTTENPPLREARLPPPQYPSNFIYRITVLADGRFPADGRIHFAQMVGARHERGASSFSYENEAED